MSSPPKEKIETKAGHPPAVKVGGMRIVQKHQSEVPEKKDDKDSKEYETERGIKTSPPLLLRWPIKNLFLRCKSFLQPITSTSTSINPASEPAPRARPSPALHRAKSAPPQTPAQVAPGSLAAKHSISPRPTNLCLQVLFFTSII
ncbi:death-associated protein 1 isoform X1 [Triplophysa dalaica]|uniref:death-associated protein 1 isoform X1 n=1 Tax=Triplophysa dalaica TaxID=1582913 RepID=UPI0024E008CD|nr:death-associated protein 1 isoform X1 [Triplophysa dalaica]